ncbi:MAG: threonine synthase [Spirochaetales bacterium]|nr:threonine synthase [Spirochaetales bacterium]
MQLKSTRNKAPEVNFTQALFTGLAPDGGLYHPLEVKNLSSLFYSWDKNTAFLQIADSLSQIFLHTELTNKVITKIVNRAFNFKPEVRALDENISLLELFHGPSCAFKDFGACFLASFMEEVLTEENKHAVILVATSGDTGSAVAKAFYAKNNIDVVILFPRGRVSFLQEKQLTTLGGNVHALEVEGSFDDCQRMVKEAFQDDKLKGSLNLTSANSINIGRLFPQSFYYVYAYTQVKEKLEGDLIFCVPSGNFGNLTAGVYAWCWGLPVDKFIAATNINDIVPEYLASKEYKPKASLHTLSNAMDVGNPSNFERLQEIFGYKHKAMAAMIHGEVVTDKETLQVIADVYRQKKLFIDPHTAVGYLAAKRMLADQAKRPVHIVTLSTAHAAKFREIVKQATGNEPELPASLKQALNLPKKSTAITNDTKELADFLLHTFL